MAKIQITDFKGIMPKIAKDKLPGNMAQLANDMKTASGDIVAYRKSSPLVALAGSSYKTFFEYLEGGNNNWVYYDAVVHWCRSPIAADSFERMYFTGSGEKTWVGLITFIDGMTDGETLTVGADVYEFDIAENGVGAGNITLGTAATTTALLCAAALVAEGPTGPAVTYTNNLDGTVTVTADNAGEVGNLIALSDSGGHIATVVTTIGRDDGVYSAFVNDLQGGGTFDFTTDFYNPGAPSAPALTFNPGYTTGAGAKYRAYFYTHVSRYGEEGPPSAILETVDASGTPNWDGTTVPLTLTGFTEPDDSDEHLKTVVGSAAPAIRIYRTSTDGSGNSAFLLVAEVAVDNTGPNSTAWAAYSYADGNAAGIDGSLGALCTTELYDRAPDNLTNLQGHPNGFFVASKDNVLYFSEPFAPWAWPTDYQIPIDSQIIGLGIYGSTIVVATDGFIYTFSGPHPASLYKTKLSFQPCLSQRAVVNTDDGVMFPSLEGFQHVTAAGVQNITASMFKPEDWVNYELETIHGTWWNKAYYGFYKSVDYEGHIIIDMLNGAITTGVGYHYAGTVALQDGKFHTIINSEITAPSVLYISIWDNNDTAFRVFSYKSPMYILEKPANFKVAQVILDNEFYETLLALLDQESTFTTLNTADWDADPNIRIKAPFNDYMFNEQDFNGDSLYSLGSLGIQDYVNFTVWVDGEIKYTIQVMDSNMFKLPRGFRDKKWEFGVDGMIPIKRITVATSTEEIV